jgi:hypothetical protein
MPHTITIRCGQIAEFAQQTGASTTIKHSHCRWLTTTPRARPVFATRRQPASRAEVHANHALSHMATESRLTRTSCPHDVRKSRPKAGASLCRHFPRRTAATQHHPPQQDSVHASSEAVPAMSEVRVPVVSCCEQKILRTLSHCQITQAHAFTCLKRHAHDCTARQTHLRPRPNYNSQERRRRSSTKRHSHSHSEHGTKNTHILSAPRPKKPPKYAASLCPSSGAPHSHSPVTATIGSTRA